MGTTLTGTTPQDTYDSLIKVTDNGPLSGTAKYLSDGLGNDSKLALSTGNIGIGTTSPSRNLHILGGAGIGTVLKLEAGSGAITYLQLAYNGATNAQSGYIGYDSSANMGLFTNDNEKVRITSAGNVGIGTATPSAKLQTTGADAASIITGIALENFIATNPASGNGVAVDFRINNSGNASVVAGKISTVNTFFRSNTDMVFSNLTSDTLTEKMRITSAGFVGIGTSSPSQKLTVYRNNAGNVNASFENAYINQGNLIEFKQNTTSGSVVGYIGHGGDSTGNLVFFNNGSVRVSILKDGGLTFNGDTAAANALDDYEEGTWTPTISFGGASTGVTYTAGTSGRYTKIGRQVSVTCYILLTNKGTSTGKASIEGLPFAISGGTGFYSAPSLGAISSITYVGMIQGYGEVGTGRIDLVETTEAGVQSVISDADFTDVSQIVMQFTYFV